MISPHDGQYALDCWLSEDDEGDSSTEYAETIDELRQRAEILLKAGRLQYLELSRWDAKADDWITIDVFVPD